MNRFSGWALAAVAAGVLGAAPAAEAKRGLIHCYHLTAEARNAAVGSVVTNTRMRCPAAEAFAASWQRDISWKGHMAWHIVDFTFRGDYYDTFHTHYRGFKGRYDPILRVQAWGTSGEFVSFMTDQ